MRAVIALAVLLIVGQAAAGEQVISVQHDSQRGVTCWIVNNTGISCVPDNQLGSLPQTAAPPNEAGRASQASSGYENGLLQATPLPQDERFQL